MARRINQAPLRAVRDQNDRYQRARERERQIKSDLWAAMVAAREEGFTLQSIGDQLGVSPQRVGQMLDEWAA